MQMMNKKAINIFTQLFLTLLFFACSSDSVQDTVLMSGTPIRLEAGLQDGNYTRSFTDMQDKAFEDQTPLSVYITTHEETPKVVGKAPITYTTSEAVNSINALTPDYQTYYPAQKSVDIFAVYPSSVKLRASDGQIAFSVPIEQTESTYLENDLMHAFITEQTRTDETLHLQFAHKMAKLVVVVTLEDELKLVSLKLKNFSRSVVLTPLTGEMGSLSDTKDITIENGVAALVPPQEIDGKTFLEVETNLGTATFSTTKTFESGKEYTIMLTIGRQSLNNSASIVDWSTNPGVAIVKDVSAVSFVIGDIAEQEYTGSAIEPDPDIESDGKKLKRNTDYRLQYHNNVNIGNAILVAIGIGEYEGKADVASFYIVKATGKLELEKKSFSEEYEKGKTVNNKFKVTGDGTVTYTSSNENVAEVRSNGDVYIKNVGKTTIRATMAEDGNYTGTTNEYELEITQRNVNKLTVTIDDPDDVVYDGTPQTPNITVMDGTEELRNDGKSYTISYANNTNAALSTATNAPTVTITGTGNYTGTNPVKFTIKQAPNTLHMNVSENTFLNVGESLNCKATADFGTVTYDSSNKSAVTISSTGMAKGVAGGVTTITIMAAGNSNYATATHTFTITVAQKVYTFSYKGESQSLTIARSGRYMLEVWGAQGGNGGGNGGYSVGYKELTAGETIYIVVGGQGGTSISATGGTGGYNGGGVGGNTYATWFSTAAGGGGGATHIAKADGLLKTFNANRSAVLIVAGGGGGGGSDRLTAGAGGGTSGGSATAYDGAVIQGGTQTEGYAFGEGQPGKTKTAYYINGRQGNGGGGGGWYGGRTYDKEGNNSNCFGSGGSGYIGGVTGGSTTAGNQRFTNINGTGQERGHSGNGYAKLTYMDE